LTKLHDSEEICVNSLRCAFYAMLASFFGCDLLDTSFTALAVVRLRMLKEVWLPSSDQALNVKVSMVALL